VRTLLRVFHLASFGFSPCAFPTPAMPWRWALLPHVVPQRAAVGASVGTGPTFTLWTRTIVNTGKGERLPDPA